MDTVVTVKFGDIKLVPLPSDAMTATERKTFRSDLIKVAQALTMQIRAAGDAAKGIRTARESRSGLLVRTFLTAILAGEETALSAALGKGADKETDVGPWSMWQAAKSMSSQATFLVQFLARNKVEVPGGKDAFVIGGESVVSITADHMEALTSPGASDTGVGTIIKYAREQSKAAEERAKRGAATEDAAITAYFEENRAAMLAPGVKATVATVHERVKAEDYKGPSIAEIVEAGRTILEDRATQAVNDEREADFAALQGRLLEMVQGADADYLDQLVTAIQARKADMATVDVAEHAEGTVHTESKGRKRA